MPDEPVFSTPDEAEAAYYAAFQAADLEAMMGVWAEADHVSCVHPVGGELLRGRERVLEAWLHLFARELDMSITLRDVHRTLGVDLAVHTGVEVFERRSQPGVRGGLVFTNVYQHTARGWKMIAHHASPGPRPAAVGAPEGFAEDSGPGRLH